MGLPIVTPSWTPERISHASGSLRGVTIRLCPGRLRSSSTWISSRVMGRRGGTPSTTQPTPAPCDSPNVVTRKLTPKVLAARAVTCLREQTHVLYPRSPCDCILLQHTLSEAESTAGACLSLLCLRQAAQQFLGCTQLSTSAVVARSGCFTANGHWSRVSDRRPTTLAVTSVHLSALHGTDRDLVGTVVVCVASVPRHVCAMSTCASRLMPRQQIKATRAIIPAAFQRCT